MRSSRAAGDDMPQVSVGQADNDNIYDNLDPLKVAGCCEEFVCVGPSDSSLGDSMVDVSVTLLALHAVTAVRLHEGAHAARMQRKTVGTLMGSASAAAAGLFSRPLITLSCARRHGKFQVKD